MSDTAKPAPTPEPAKEPKTSSTPPAGVPDITAAAAQKQAAVQDRLQGALRGRLLNVPRGAQHVGPARPGAQPAPAPAPAPPRVGFVDGPAPERANAVQTGTQIQAALSSGVRQIMATIEACDHLLPALADPELAAHVAVVLDLDVTRAEAFRDDLRALIAKHLSA